MICKEEIFFLTVWYTDNISCQFINDLKKLLEWINIREMNINSIFSGHALLTLEHVSFKFGAEYDLKRKVLAKNWYTQIFIVHKQTSAKFFWHCKKYKISKEIETMCLLTMVYTYAPQHINYFWNGV